MVKGKGRFEGCIWAAGAVCGGWDHCVGCWKEKRLFREGGKKLRIQPEMISPLLHSLLPAVTTVHPEQLYPALYFSRNYHPINPGSPFFPPSASEGTKSTAIQVHGGISDLAIKVFNLCLVEYQQGQVELCFFPKLQPKGILLVWNLSSFYFT